MDTWRGVPLSDIYGCGSPWDAPEFPLVSPAYNHTVLFHIGRSGGGVCDKDKPPSPQRGKDKWDKDSVRMPCSEHSLYPVLEDNGSTNLVKRWEMIKSALQKRIHNSQGLADAICSYNTKFKNQWKFRALHHLFNEYLEEEESAYFFAVTLPAISKLALALPQLVQAPIPLLRQHKNRSISLTQEQVASLLANAFFCTFPRRNTSKKTSEYATYPYINFNSLYEASPTPPVMEKLKCICHYFRRVCRKVPAGVLTFTRRSVEPARCPAWEASSQLVGSTPLHVDSSGTIEDDGVGLIQVDFANKYLGGGVLNHGCVQEEIRFVICPELLVSMLFTEMLRPTEALLIIGCERYSSYTGYAGTFQWAGDYSDGTPRDASGRRRCAVLAIDALPFTDERHQYRAQLITRELNKAWAGVTAGGAPTEAGALLRPGVATGNWGCGAFGGTAALKSLLQLMACAQARRPLAYYTFGDVELRNRIVCMYNFLSQHHVTVGQLFRYLIKFSEANEFRSELYAFIHQLHTDEVKKSEVAAENTPDKESCKTASEVVPLTHTDSPDMFSSGEMDSLSKCFIDLEKGEGTLHVNIGAAEIETPTKSPERAPTTSRHKPPACDQEISISEPDRWAVTHQTTTLFEEMTQIDEENCKGQFNESNCPSKGKRSVECLPPPKNVSESEVKHSQSSSTICESVGQCIDSQVTPTNSSRTLEALTQERCKSNVSATSEQSVIDCKKAGTKKMAKKITDYFNKKC